MRTYHPLIAYYHPIIYVPLGYFSNTYHIIYYDGYGYNFYYGNYGYYEYSIHGEGPNIVVHTTAHGLIWTIVVVVLVAFCCCWVCVARHRSGYVECESE